MDGIQREEWNVADFESHLAHFGKIKYHFMGNLTVLERRQDRLLNLSYAADGDIDIEQLNEAMVLYLNSLNESKLTINESVSAMQMICDECQALMETVKETQEGMMDDTNGTSLSPYNPTRLIWNVYYIYFGMSLSGKCKEYSTVMESLCLQSGRVLSIQRDFMRQTRFTQLLTLIEGDSKLTILIGNTRDFVDELLFFENVREYPI